MYGIDIDLDAPRSCPVLRVKSWRWFVVRLRGLLEIPASRLYLALNT